MHHSTLRVSLILTTAALLSVLVSASAQAQTDLDFQLQNPTVIAGAGTTLTFRALLTNTGANSLFLNSDFGLVDAPLSVDDGKFIDAFLLGTANPLPADGIPHLFDLFDVTLPDGLAPGSVYHGSFTLLGGSDENAVEELGAQNFDITVGNITPESGSLALFAPALAAMGVFALRRKTGALRLPWRRRTSGS